MKHTMKKAVGVCAIGAFLLLSNSEYARAVSVQGGIEAEAGASVLLEQYYNAPVATKKAEPRVVTTAPQDIYQPIEGYTNLGIAKVEDSLNVRETPGDGEILGRMPKDAACEILSEEDGWYYVSSGDISGYVSKDYMLTGEAALQRAHEVMELVATVTADGLNLREEPNTGSSIIEMLGNSEKLQVLEQQEGWAKVQVDNTEGYVSLDYISVSPELQTARTLEQLKYGTEVSDLRAQMVEFAQQFVGYPYVYGGNSLTKGTDCSGFTNLIYAHFGISIPRTATTQYNYGNKISTSELKPGDLIIYGEYQIEHVGMYIGDGMIVHASNERTGIKYSQMNYRNIIGCVRMIND